MQTHFGADVVQSLHQIVRRSHPGLERAEDMLDRAPTDAGRLRHLVEASLHRLKHFLMLPATNSSVVARRALGVDRASRTR